MEAVRFAESQALSGVLIQPTLTRLEKAYVSMIAIQSLPASGSQLKDYTLFEVRKMLEQKDFSLATQAQLQMVSKIIKNPDRLMEKH